MQQEDLATPRSPAISKPAICKPAISKSDCALDNRRKVLDHSRRTGLPVAFFRMINASAFFNRATPSIHWAEGFESYRSEMIFERNSSSCYSGEPFTRIYAEAFPTDDLIERTLPRKLGYGKNAGG
jgi:hypothetical protein